jgi:DNA-binding YbaB/EbfC family protein
VLKGLANFGSILKHAQEIGGRMKGLNDELRARRVTGSSGGGMVEIEANGLMQVSSCRIDPSLVAQADRELLEDLVAAAMNDVVAKGKELHAQVVREMTGDIELPGLDEALGKFLGQNVSGEPQDLTDEDETEDEER